jgi:putative hydrolase of HD superfamily
MEASSKENFKYADLLKFFQYILRLKSVKRVGWVTKAKVYDGESVAEHSYAESAVGMIMSDLIGLDTEKVMKMIILHDLAESIIGDYVPGEVSPRKKRSEEYDAMNNILHSLPSDIRSTYKKIWNEFCYNKTCIAQFVHKIDKLEMALQAKEYSNRGIPDDLIAQFLDSAENSIGKGNSDIVAGVLNALRTCNAKY